MYKREYQKYRSKYLKEVQMGGNPDKHTFNSFTGNLEDKTKYIKKVLTCKKPSEKVDFKDFHLMECKDNVCSELLKRETTYEKKYLCSPNGTGSIFKINIKLRYTHTPIIYDNEYYEKIYGEFNKRIFHEYGDSFGNNNILAKISFWMEIYNIAPAYKFPENKEDQKKYVEKLLKNFQPYNVFDIELLHRLANEMDKLYPGSFVRFIAGKLGGVYYDYVPNKFNPNGKKGKVYSMVKNNRRLEAKYLNTLIEYNGKGNEFDDIYQLQYLHKIHIDSSHRIMMIGDIHSSLHSLIDIINQHREYFKDDTLVLSDECSIIFLGDFVDRGPYNIEVLVMVFVLKLLNKDKVFLINGNHENYSNSKTYGQRMNELNAFEEFYYARSYKDKNYEPKPETKTALGDLIYDIDAEYGKNEKLKKLFNLLNRFPTGIVLEHADSRYFLSHGGFNFVVFMEECIQQYRHFFIEAPQNSALILTSFMQDKGIYIGQWNVTKYLTQSLWKWMDFIYDGETDYSYIYISSKDIETSDKSDLIDLYKKLDTQGIKFEIMNENATVTKNGLEIRAPDVGRPKSNLVLLEKFMNLLGLTNCFGGHMDLISYSVAMNKDQQKQRRDVFKMCRELPNCMKNNKNPLPYLLSVAEDNYKSPPIIKEIEFPIHHIPSFDNPTTIPREFNMVKLSNAFEAREPHIFATAVGELKPAFEPIQKTLDKIDTRSKDIAKVIQEALDADVPAEDIHKFVDEYMNKGTATHPRIGTHHRQFYQPPLPTATT